MTLERQDIRDHLLERVVDEGIVSILDHQTCDVLACSASILHLMFISVGRYRLDETDVGRFIEFDATL